MTLACVPARHACNPGWKVPACRQPQAMALAKDLLRDDEAATTACTVASPAPGHGHPMKGHPACNPDLPIRARRQPQAVETANGVLENAEPALARCSPAMLTAGRGVLTVVHQAYNQG